MKQMKPVIQILALFALCVISACSTPQHAAPKPETGPAPVAKASSFDIRYSIGGHTEHRLEGTSSSPASAGEPRVATFDEREIIDEETVNAESYNRFVAHLLNFIQSPQRVPAQEPECRSPYAITLKIDGKTYSSKGCREGKGGDFAKLVREGEFLLYSKK